MGWWHQGADGSSLHTERTGLLWGDEPADIMDAALERIAGSYQTVLGRWPTADELRGGLDLYAAGQQAEAPWAVGTEHPMDRALAEITSAFRRTWRRRPTPEELRAGLEFSLSCLDLGREAEVDDGAQAEAGVDL